MNVNILLFSGKTWVIGGVIRFEERGQREKGKGGASGSVAEEAIEGTGRSLSLGG